MKIIKIFKEVFTVLFILILALYLFFSITNQQLVIEKIGFRPFVVMSDSMKPKFEKGDIIIVSKTNISDLKVGDIIAGVKKDGVFISHYIADSYESNGKKYFKTRKENATERKDWDYESLREDQIIGKTTKVIPKLGHLVLFIKNPIGIITIVLSLIIITILKRIN